MNANELETLIKGRMEDTRVREIIRAFFERYRGKTWTRVYRDKLALEFPGRVADDLIQREDEFLGIEIMTRSYLNKGGREGWCFTVAKGGWQKAPDKIMCPVKLAEWNPAHFRGADERNAQRREALADPFRLANAAACLEALKAARVALKAARVALTASREGLEPDWYAILEAAGVAL